jgi:hypothetical protein
MTCPGRERFCRCWAWGPEAPLWVSLAFADWLVKLSIAVAR